MEDFLINGPIIFTCLSPLWWLLLFFMARDKRGRLITYRINLVLVLAEIAAGLSLLGMETDTLGGWLIIIIGSAVVTLHTILVWIALATWRRHDRLQNRLKKFPTWK